MISEVSTVYTSRKENNMKGKQQQITIKKIIIKKKALTITRRNNSGNFWFLWWLVRKSRMISDAGTNMETVEVLFELQLSTFLEIIIVIIKENKLIN